MPRNCFKIYFCRILKEVSNFCDQCMRHAAVVKKIQKMPLNNRSDTKYALELSLTEDNYLELIIISSTSIILLAKSLLC